MSDEILLSESNFERVYLNEGWETRIELTEDGGAFFAARDAARALPRGAAPWAWAATGAAAASGILAVVWKILG